MKNILYIKISKMYNIQVGGIKMIELIHKFDFAILDFIHNNLSSPIMDKLMVFITTLGNAGMIWIVIGLVMLCTKKYRKTGIMMVVGLTIGLILGNFILKPGIGRIRPFGIKEGIELLIKAPSDYSFPSGHTLASVISAVIILLCHKKIGYYTTALAVLIAFSRLMSINSLMKTRPPYYPPARTKKRHRAVPCVFKT